MERAVGDVEIAGSFVNGDATRADESGSRGTVVAERLIVAAGVCADRSAAIDLANARIAVVGDEDVAVSIDGDTARIAEFRLRGLAAVATEAALFLAGDDRDRLGLCIDAIERVVGDEVEIVDGIERQPPRLEAHARRGRAVGRRIVSTAGIRGDLVRRVDAPDAFVIQIGEINRASGIDRDVTRKADHCGRRVGTFLILCVHLSRLPGDRRNASSR